MRFIKLFYFIILIFCIQNIQANPNFKIVGYYGLRSAMADPDIRAFKYLTHINLWFLNPDSLGNFTQDLSALIPFIDKAHRKNIKVLFSIGGGTKQPQYHHLLRDQRDLLIQNLISTMLKYNIDGVDVDLEGSNIDEYYEPFVVALASALRSHQKLISAAVAVYYKNQFTDAALNAFDFINIMSYDRTGPWRPEKPGPHATFTDAVADLRYFGIERKISKDKMTLGVPFYGYGYGPQLSSKAISLNYNKIISTYAGADQVDEWLQPDGNILYYNGIPTMRQKTLLAKQMASGIMIWQVLGDAKRKKSLLKVIHREGIKKSK